MFIFFSNETQITICYHHSPPMVIYIDQARICMYDPVPELTMVHWVVISINKVHNALTSDSDEDKDFHAFPEASSSGTELGLIFLIIEKRGLY